MSEEQQFHILNSLSYDLSIAKSEEALDLLGRIEFTKAYLFINIDREDKHKIIISTLKNSTKHLGDNINSNLLKKRAEFVLEIMTDPNMWEKIIKSGPLSDEHEIGVNLFVWEELFKVSNHLSLLEYISDSLSKDIFLVSKKKVNISNCCIENL